MAKLLFLPVLSASLVFHLCCAEALFESRLGDDNIELNNKDARNGKHLILDNDRRMTTKFDAKIRSKNYQINEDAGRMEETARHRRTIQNQRYGQNNDRRGDSPNARTEERLRRMDTESHPDRSLSSREDERRIAEQRRSGREYNREARRNERNLNERSQQRRRTLGDEEERREDGDYRIQTRDIRQRNERDARRVRDTTRENAARMEDRLRALSDQNSRNINRAFERESRTERRRYGPNSEARNRIERRALDDEARRHENERAEFSDEPTRGGRQNYNRASRSEKEYSTESNTRRVRDQLREETERNDRNSRRDIERRLVNNRRTMDEISNIVRSNADSRVKNNLRTEERNSENREVRNEGDSLRKFTREVRRRNEREEDSRERIHDENLDNTRRRESRDLNTRSELRSERRIRILPTEDVARSRDSTRRERAREVRNESNILERISDIVRRNADTRYRSIRRTGRRSEDEEVRGNVDNLRRYKRETRYTNERVHISTEPSFQEINDEDRRSELRRLDDQGNRREESRYRGRDSEHVERNDVESRTLSEKRANDERSLDRISDIVRNNEKERVRSKNRMSRRAIDNEDRRTNDGTLTRSSQEVRFRNERNVDLNKRVTEERRDNERRLESKDVRDEEIRRNERRLTERRREDVERTDNFLQREREFRRETRDLTRVSNILRNNANSRARSINRMSTRKTEDQTVGDENRSSRGSSDTVRHNDESREILNDGTFAQRRNEERRLDSRISEDRNRIRDGRIYRVNLREDTERRDRQLERGEKRDVRNARRDIERISRAVRNNAEERSRNSNDLSRRERLEDSRRSIVSTSENKRYLENTNSRRREEKRAVVDNERRDENWQNSLRRTDREEQRREIRNRQSDLDDKRTEHDMRSESRFAKDERRILARSRSQESESRFYQEERRQERRGRNEERTNRERFSNERRRNVQEGDNRNSRNEERRGENSVSRRVREERGDESDSRRIVVSERRADAPRRAIQRTRDDDGTHTNRNSEDRQHGLREFSQTRRLDEESRSEAITERRAIRMEARIARNNMDTSHRRDNERRDMRDTSRMLNREDSRERRVDDTSRFSENRNQERIFEKEYINNDGSRFANQRRNTNNRREITSNNKFDSGADFRRERMIERTDPRAMPTKENQRRDNVAYERKHKEIDVRTDSFRRNDYRLNPKYLEVSRFNWNHPDTFFQIRNTVKMGNSLLDNFDSTLFTQVLLGGLTIGLMWNRKQIGGEI